MGSDGYLLGIDMGTLVCKSAIFHIDGTMMGLSRIEYPMEHVRLGWVEQDQKLWWCSVRTTIKETLSKTRISPEDIIAVGCTAQSHGPTPISKDGKVLMKCIIWPDRRAMKQERWIIENAPIYEGVVRDHNNQSLTESKLLWIKENRPEIWRTTFKFLLPKCFLVWKLTDELVEEPLDADGTGMFDHKRMDWCDELLELYGIPRNKLVDIKRPWDVVSGVCEKAAEDTGLAKGTPVVVGAADGPCQRYGAGFIKAGRGLDRCGTVGGLSVAVERPSGYIRFSLTPDIVSKSARGTQTAAASYRWFRDEFCSLEITEAVRNGKDVYQVMDQKAENVEPGSGGIFFVPQLLGRGGRKNRYGITFGLTLQTKREQIIRSIMEGFAYEIRRGKEENWDPYGITCDEVWTTGGGGKSGVWRQIKADILGLTYCRTNIEETGCFGAACIAGFGVGVYKDLIQPIESTVKVVERNYPKPKNKKRYDKLFQIYRKLNTTLEKSNIYNEYVTTLEETKIYLE